MCLATITAKEAFIHIAASFALKFGFRITPSHNIPDRLTSK